MHYLVYSRGPAEMRVESEVFPGHPLGREDNLAGMLGKMLDNVIDNFHSRYEMTFWIS